MRRRTFDILVATFYNKEMTILYAGDKLHPLTAEMPVKIAYEFRALFGGQMSAMMSADFSAPAETDDIAPHSHVTGFHFIAYARGFERPAPFIDFIKIVAEDGGVRHFAAWSKAVRNGHKPSTTAFMGQTVKIGSRSLLERCFSTKPGDGMV